MDVDSLGQTSTGQAPEEAPSSMGGAFQEPDAEQQIGHRGCHEWVPLRAKGSPSRKERVSGDGGGGDDEQPPGEEQVAGNGGVPEVKMFTSWTYFDGKPWK